MSQPWDRRDDENDSAWALFCIYREMDRPRKRGKFVELAQVSASTYTRHVSKYDWKRRAAALDEFRAQAAMSANIQAIKDREIERVMQVVDLRRLAYQNVKAQSEQLKPGESIKLLDVALRHELGIDTLDNARKAQGDDGIDYSLLTAEERAEIIEHYRRVDEIVLDAMKARKGNGKSQPDAPVDIKN